MLKDSWQVTASGTEGEENKGSLSHRTSGTKRRATSRACTVITSHHRHKLYHVIANAYCLTKCPTYLSAVFSVNAESDCMCVCLRLQTGRRQTGRRQTGRRQTGRRQCQD